MKPVRYLVFLIILPLALGMFIYIFFRKHTLLHMVLGIEGQPAFAADTWLTQIVAYQLPDFFWALSFGAAIFLFQYVLKGENKFLTALAFFLVVGSEFIQLAFPRQFRFDGWDVIAAIFALLLSYCLKPKRNEA